MREELYFPLFVDRTKNSIIVIGAGKIAARRVKSLLPFVGEMKVIVPEVCSENKERAAASEGALVIEQRPFESSDLDGADMVLAVTNDKELNTRIGALCKEKKILVNVSHEKELCDFYFPGVVQKDNVVIGITASGKDHSEARKVTEQIRAMMEDDK